MPSAVAPSTDNLSILKAVASFTPEGGSIRVLGNAPSIQLTFNLDVLDHFSSMEGIRTKDLSVVREASATIVMQLEEWDPENVQLVVLGSDPDATSGQIEILAQTEIIGALLIVGQNTVGVQLQWDFPKVSFRPSGNLDLISEEWATMEITGEVLFDSTANSWGTVKELTAAP